MHLGYCTKQPIFVRNTLFSLEIANPIYDVVFKYLMEDNKVAKIFLSAVTGLDHHFFGILTSGIGNGKEEHLRHWS